MITDIVTGDCIEEMRAWTSTDIPVGYHLVVADPPSHDVVDGGWPV